MCPYSARLLTGRGGLLEPAEAIAHVLAIESSDGLVLVDTGLGAADVANPARTGAFFRHVLRPRYEITETAVEQLRGLGFNPVDVTDIVLTHLDVDHAGGLGDFPQARVHVFAAELEAVLNPGLRERLRYVPQQWAHGPRWTPHGPGGDRWRGFGSVRAIERDDLEVALVPLPGHSRGHSAVAVRLDGAGEDERWLLHCGDAYFHHGEIGTPPRSPIGIRAFEGLVELDREQRLVNQERLRELARQSAGEPLEIFCAHDREEFERLAGAGSAR